MGMSGSQRFWRVELPLALPLVMSGVRLALVQVWATATIAALVAGPGVGRIIVDGFARNLYSQGIAAAVVVALAALILELAAAAVQRAADPVPREPRRTEATHHVGGWRLRCEQNGGVSRRHRTRAGRPRGTQKVDPHDHPPNPYCCALGGRSGSRRRLCW